LLRRRYVCRHIARAGKDYAMKTRAAAKDMRAAIPVTICHYMLLLPRCLFDIYVKKKKKKKKKKKMRDFTPAPPCLPFAAAMPINGICCLLRHAANIRRRAIHFVDRYGYARTRHSDIRTPTADAEYSQPPLNLHAPLFFPL